MTIKTVSTDDLRVGLRDALDAVLTGTEVVIERYRKPSAVLINYAQWQAFKALQEKETIAHARQLCADMQSGKVQSISHEDMLQALMQKKFGALNVENSV
jgi:PHD/YefM family antitoxin component YafN of YafNO toxin-antitoxin module